MYYLLYSRFSLTCEKAEIKMETFEYRKSRIWEMKEDKYTKSLAKNQVYTIVH